MFTSLLKSHLSPAGDYTFGFADLRGLLDRKFEGYSYGISIGKRLDDRIVDGIRNGPTLEYFHHYREVNLELDELTGRISRELAGRGIDALPIKATIALHSKEYDKYIGNLTYDISHKMVATRAGLGWIGKTDLLVSKAFGPRLRLASILLSQDPGGVAVPIVKSRCGKCNICVDLCPAKAANGKLWNTGIHRDEFFNARQCREKCGELARNELHVDERICGLCVSVCPAGKKKIA